MQTKLNHHLVREFRLLKVSDNFREIAIVLWLSISSKNDTDPGVSIYILLGVVLPPPPNPEFGFPMLRSPYLKDLNRFNS